VKDDEGGGEGREMSQEKMKERERGGRIKRI